MRFDARPAPPPHDSGDGASSSSFSVISACLCVCAPLLSFCVALYGTWCRLEAAGLMGLAWCRLEAAGSMGVLLARPNRSACEDDRCRVLQGAVYWVCTGCVCDLYRGGVGRAIICPRRPSLLIQPFSGLATAVPLSPLRSPLLRESGGGMACCPSYSYDLDLAAVATGLRGGVCGVWPTGRCGRRGPHGRCGSGTRCSGTGVPSASALCGPDVPTDLSPHS